MSTDMWLLGKNDLYVEFSKIYWLITLTWEVAKQDVPIGLRQGEASLASTHNSRKKLGSKYTWKCD